MKLYDFIDKLLVIAERLNEPFFKAKNEGNKFVEVFRLLTYPFKQALFLGWNLVIVLLLIIFMYSCYEVNTHDNISKEVDNKVLKQASDFKDWYNKREKEREETGYYKKW